MDRHSPRRFVQKVDFITTPGYLYGPGAREEEGLSPRTGPSKVITDLCLFDFDPKTKIMRLKALHPNVTLNDVKKSTGFEFIIPNNIETTIPPSEEDLRLLHEVVDPNGFVFKK